MNKFISVRAVLSHLLWVGRYSLTLLPTKYAHALAKKKGLVQNYTLTRAKAGM